MRLRTLSVAVALSALPLVAACGGSKPVADSAAQPVVVGCFMATDDLPMAEVEGLVGRCDERIIRSKVHPVDGLVCQEDEVCAVAKLRDEGVWP